MDYKVFSQMQTGVPVQSYRKTILGKVLVKIIDPFTQEPTEIILEGKDNKSDTAVYDAWSDMEKLYFERANSKHIKQGTVISYERKDVHKAKSVNQLTDEEIDELVNSKFFTLQNKLNSFTSEAPVLRLLKRAEELEKSERILSTIRARLSELQDLSLVGSEDAN